MTLEDAAVTLLEVTNRFLPWQLWSRVGGNLLLELETYIPVRARTGTSLNKPVALLQSFWVHLLLRMGIYVTGYGTEFVHLKLFFSLQERLMESDYRSGWKRVCVCISNDFVLKTHLTDDLEEMKSLLVPRLWPESSFNSKHLFKNLMKYRAMSLYLF